MVYTTAVLHITGSYSRMAHELTWNTQWSVKQTKWWGAMVNLLKMMDFKNTP